MIFAENTYKTYKADHVSKIIQIMVDKFGVDEDVLSYNSSFSNDLNIDSLDLFEFIAELEKEFEIKIPDEEAERLATVGSVIDYIYKRIMPEH